MAHSTRRILDDNGFSLTEVIIALGVSSILILGTMSLTQNSMKATRNASLSVDFNNVVSNIRMLINDEAQCSLILKDMVYPTGPQPVAPIQEISIRGAPIAKLDKTVNGLKTTQLELVGLSAVPADAVINYGGVFLNKVGATLRLTMEKTGETLGSKTFQREFQMTVLTDPASQKIQTCYGEISKLEIAAAVRTQVKKEICEELGGGFDLSTNKCTPVSVKRLVDGEPGNPMGGMNMAVNYLKARAQNNATAQTATKNTQVQAPQAQVQSQTPAVPAQSQPTNVEDPQEIQAQMQNVQKLQKQMQEQMDQLKQIPD